MIVSDKLYLGQCALMSDNFRGSLVSYQLINFNKFWKVVNGVVLIYK